MTTIRDRLAVSAAIVIVALTAAAFWLSYAHLHTVAASHGLANSPARSWAWPATLDAFVIAGELLMLRASLMRRSDWWAIGLTVTGSGGSIALNVFGVQGADPLAYVVAAVPPTAALLAFGALMRQIHVFLADRSHPEIAGHILLSAPLGGTAAAFEKIPDQRLVICSGDSSAFDLTANLARLVATTGGRSAASTTPAGGAELPPAVTPNAANTPLPAVANESTPGDSDSDNRRQDEPPATASPAPELAPAPRQRTPRVGASKKTTRRSMTEWVELAGPIFHSEFEQLRRQPTGDEFAEAIKRARLGTVSASTAKNIRAEILDRAPLPALD